MWMHIRLLLDLHSTKLFVWMLVRMFGPLGRLDADLFFYHRYSELADYHRAHERRRKAIRLDAIAEAHYQAAPPGGPFAGDDDTPPAAVAALPARRRIVRTTAVGTPWPPRTPTRSSTNLGITSWH